MRQKIKNNEIKKLNETQIQKLDDYDKELKTFMNMIVSDDDDSLSDEETLLKHVKDASGKKKYSIDTKKLALMFLDNMQHISGIYEGRPMYQRVGKIMGIDPRNLFNWYTSERSKIEQTVTAFNTNMSKYVTLKLNVILLKTLNEIGNRDLSKIWPKDLFSLFNVLYPKWRLQEGLSTENIAVAHKVLLPAPKEDK